MGSGLSATPAGLGEAGAKLLEMTWLKLYTSKPRAPVGKLSPGLSRDPAGSPIKG